MMERQDRIRVWDLKICKNIQLLKEAHNLILYGAAEKGKEVLYKLRDANINVSKFCDFDSNKWDEKIEGIDIISPFMLEDYFVGSGTIYIIACVSKPQVVKKMLDHMRCKNYDGIRFISYWGITVALYINRDIIYHSNCRTYQFYLLMQEKKINAYKNYPTYILDDFLMNPSNLWLILPGKTASSTLLEQLRIRGVPTLRRHILEYPEYILGNKYRDLWNQVISGRLKQKIKVIVSVREPISRDYFAFWQSFSSGEDYTERGLYMPFLEKDFQKYYDIYMRLISSGNAFLKNELGIYMCYSWGDEFEWMDDQIKKCLNIDVYQYPFDKEKGYSIIKKDNVELFLYRMEDMKEVSDAIEKFVGVSGLPPIRRNVSEEKWYGLACEQFKNEVKLSRKYVDHYYDGNDKMDHFYSKEEQRIFLKQWENQIE